MTTQPVTKISDVSKASQGQDIRFYLLDGSTFTREETYDNHWRKMLTTFCQETRVKKSEA